MSGFSPRVAYAQVSAAPTVIKSGPGAFYGFICVASSAGTLTLYDNTAASGTVLFTKAVAAGDVVTLGAWGMSFKLGLTAAIGGTSATVNVAYT